MTRAVIAISVMAHPLRSAEAEALAERVGEDFPTRVVYDPEPDGPPATLRTARLAWRPWHRGQTHHLLLQDDAAPRPDFGRCLRGVVRAHPDRWVSLACEWGSKTSWVCRAAALSGRPFGPAVDAYVPVWGLLMPAGQAQDLAGWLLSVDDSVPDDHALNDFTRARGLRTPLITVPNLIEHGAVGSLIDNDSMLGHRRSALTTSQPVPEGWRSRPVLDEVAGLPFTMYWQPAYPRVLVAPGHDGYDFASLRFGSEELLKARTAWRAFGVDVDGLTADALSNVALTLRAVGEHVRHETLAVTEEPFGRSLLESAVRGCVLGVLRKTLAPAELRQQAAIKRFLHQWALGPSHG